MYIRDGVFLAKEGIIKNCVVYDLMIVTVEGIKYTKEFIEADKEEEYLKEVKRKYPDATIYIPKTIRKSSNEMEPVIITNEALEQFTKDLFRILSLEPANIPDSSSSKFVVSIYPQAAIFDTETFAVKIPIQIQNDMHEISYDYEYLILPDFTVNHDFLDTLNKTYNQTFQLDTTDVNTNCYFSASLYDLFRTKIFMTALEVKPIINAIRALGYDSNYTNPFYCIFQNTQIVKKDRMNTVKWQYLGPWENITMPQMFNMAGYEAEDVYAINANAAKRAKFIKEFEGTDIKLKPIISYLKCTDMPIEEVFFKYEALEKMRQYYKVLLYTMHINFCKSYERTAEYLVWMNLSGMKVNKITCGLEMNWYVNGNQTVIQKKTYKPRSK